MNLRLPLLLLSLAAIAGCREPLKPDHPKLSPDVRMTDLHIESRILDKQISVRVVTPVDIAPDANLPVVYLLHGADATYKTWSNESAIASFAGRGVILVMPDAGDSYYINDARGHRFEDYFFTELIPEIHRQFPFATTSRDHTAIVGISRGGYAAVLYSLHHPQLFSYAAGLSSALDLAERRFRVRSPIESWEYRRIFDTPGSPQRVANDLHSLLDRTAPATAPYFYLTCGDSDTLLVSNQNFVAHLEARKVPHEFHLLHGGHNWSVWSAQVPALEASILAHFSLAPVTP